MPFPEERQKIKIEVPGSGFDTQSRAGLAM
jgi:hypothetical protein